MTYETPEHVEILAETMRANVHASWTLLPRLHECDALSDAITRAAVTLAAARAEDDEPWERETADRLARLGADFQRAVDTVIEGINTLRGSMEYATARLHARLAAGEPLAAVRGTMEGEGTYLFDYSRALALIDAVPREIETWSVDRVALYAAVEAMGDAETATA